MVLMVNNLGGLSFLELGIMADAAVRSLGEPCIGRGPPRPLELLSLQPFEARHEKSSQDGVSRWPRAGAYRQTGPSQAITLPADDWMP